jgi:UDP-glucose 4-epimerase
VGERALTRHFVVGGAGFIGSHLVDRLVQRGPVVVYDNLSSGRRCFLERHLASGACQLIEGDVLDGERIAGALQPSDIVFHLAANPEARAGLTNTRLDLEQGTIGTWNVLDAMRRAGARRVVFASSGTVYGDTPVRRAEPDLGQLPISLYGASKLAGEALVSAYCHCFQLQGWIFRFGNVVGARATHGVVRDFLLKLQQNPSELLVLGDGRQRKPYLLVNDCVEAVLFAMEHAQAPLNVFNIAPPDVTPVSRIAELCISASPYPSARVLYAGGERGWPGDVATSRLDAAAIETLGFPIRRSSDQAVESAVRSIASEIFGEGACRQ